MGKLNEFRLSWETSFLFVLSDEYDLPFAELVSLYNLSDKIFWAYLSMFSNMSKLGVRKSNQLAKIANRIFKKIRNLPDKRKRKVDVDVIDDEGNIVIDEKTGQPKKTKKIVIEYFDIEPTPDEERLMATMKYFITRGYSNGDTFIEDNDIVDMKSLLTTDFTSDVITIDGEPYSRCSKIEHILEKYFPEMVTSEFRKYSVKNIYEMLRGLETTEEEFECEGV